MRKRVILGRPWPINLALGTESRNTHLYDSGCHRYHGVFRPLPAMWSDSGDYRSGNELEVGGLVIRIDDLLAWVASIIVYQVGNWF